MTRITRRRALQTGAAAALVAALPRPASATTRTILNDASRLSPTPVNKHWVVGADQQATFIERLRAELKAAAAERRPVALSAARHSMGGQSLPRNGTAITLQSPGCEIDAAAMTARVLAGTRWGEAIDILDEAGFSPAVMQSNNDFGVASTFSVNAHGWPAPYGPFGATVRRIEIMLADGSVLTASPTENDEIFRLAMGGYGLIGAILSLEIDIVRNELLKPRYSVMESGKLAAAFMEAVRAPGTRMLYGRMNVARRGFFEEAMLIAYEPEPTSEPLPKAGTGGFASGVSRRVYRAQVGSEVAKRARWLAETTIGARSGAGIATRNALMNEPVANLASTDKRRTDILHEYFVPPDRFADFVGLCQSLIPKSGQELLNITLRYVSADKRSVLAFAPTERIAGVMSFTQRVTPEAEEGMLKLTEALIDGVAGLGGSFYLPYRLHARPDQVRAIYPRTGEFVARKRHHDPNLVFRNALWHAYFEDGA